MSTTLAHKKGGTKPSLLANGITDLTTALKKHDVVIDNNSLREWRLQRERCEKENVLPDAKRHRVEKESVASGSSGGGASGVAFRLGRFGGRARRG